MPARPKLLRVWIQIAPILGWLWIPFGNFLTAVIQHLILKNLTYARADSTRVLRRESFLLISSVMIYLATFVFAGFFLVTVWIIVCLAWSIVSTIAILLGSPPVSTPEHLKKPIASHVAIALTLLTAIYVPLLYFNWRADDQISFHYIPKAPVYLKLPSHSDPTDYKAERDHFTAELAARVYDEDEALPLGHWATIATAENSTSGFQARAYQFRNGEIVLAFRGTELTPTDIISDLSMLFGIQPRQFRDGQQFFELMNSRSPVKYVVGHSLGGAIAQYVAARNLAEGLTINPFGAVPLTEKAYYDTWLKNRKPSSVINLRSTSDIVSDAHFEYTLIGIISNGVEFLSGRFSHHVGCITQLQYGGYNEHRKPFPESLLQAHKSSDFVNILRTNDLIDPNEYRCSGPQNRLGLLLGLSRLRPNATTTPK